MVKLGCHVGLSEAAALRQLGRARAGMLAISITHPAVSGGLETLLWYVDDTRAPPQDAACAARRRPRRPDSGHPYLIPWIGTGVRRWAA
jgi:hypothetical protein